MHKKQEELYKESTYIASPSFNRYPYFAWYYYLFALKYLLNE